MKVQDDNQDLKSKLLQELAQSQNQAFKDKLALEIKNRKDVEKKSSKTFFAA